MRTVLLGTLAAGLLASACCAPPAPSQPPSHVSSELAAAAQSVWHLHIQLRRVTEKGEQEFATSVATAFPVGGSQGKVLFFTAAHAVVWAAEIEMIEISAHMAGGRELLGGRFHSRAPAHDVAAVEFDLPEGEEIRPLELRKEPVEFGERLFVSGYPAGDPDNLPDSQLFLTEGLCSGLGVASAPVYGGSSGSPVLDSKGHVVGVVTRVGVDQRGYPVPRVIPHKLYYVPISEL